MISIANNIENVLSEFDNSATVMVVATATIHNV